LAVGVVVRSVEGDGEESEIGTVSAIEGSTITVQLLSGASKVAASEQWQACPPVKNDRVYIAAGEHLGRSGKLIGLDRDDGFVRVVGLDMIIVPLSTLVKYRDSD
jgi:hypothetical protein